MRHEEGRRGSRVGAAAAQAGHQGSAAAQQPQQWVQLRSAGQQVHQWEHPVHRRCAALGSSAAEAGWRTGLRCSSLRGSSGTTRRAPRGSERLG